MYSDGSEGTFRAMFQEPLEVEPAVQYIAFVTLKVSRRPAVVSPPRRLPCGVTPYTTAYSATQRGPAPGCSHQGRAVVD